MTKVKGGCLCGHIRYVALAEPDNPHLCSCRQCQRWSGAPVVAWADVPLAALIFNGPGGEPLWYRSSNWARRGFCPICGGTVCAADDGASVIGLTVATFDDPEIAAPVSHSFSGSAPCWLRVATAVDEGDGSDH